MKLLVDAGNSRIKWARLVNDDLQYSGAINYTGPEVLEKLTAAWHELEVPEQVLIANVAGNSIGEVLDIITRDLWGKSTVVASVEKEYRGLKNAYRKISQLGIDRWLALIASWVQYPAPVCLVSCGTAVTLDAIAKSGQHLGGLIIPGVFLQQEILNKYTSRINLEPGDNFKLNLGKSTDECVSNGAVRSVVSLIESVKGELTLEHGDNLSCIISGGYGGKINRLLPKQFIYEPDLVLKGLSIISADLQ